MNQPPVSLSLDHWTASTTTQLLATLNAGPDGLSAAESGQRLRRYGMNSLRRKREWPLVLHFLARFTQPMLLVLLAAAGVSAMLGDLTSFGLIVSIVVMSVALDFVQEYRAGRAAEALEQSVALVARTLRDGQATSAPVTGLVPGDVVLLSAGGIVPADGRLLAADDLYVNQAALTGEAFRSPRGFPKSLRKASRRCAGSTRFSWAARWYPAARSSWYARQATPRFSAASPWT